MDINFIPAIKSLQTKKICITLYCTPHTKCHELANKKTIVWISSSSSSSSSFSSSAAAADTLKLAALNIYPLLERMIQRVGFFKCQNGLVIGLK